MTALPFGSDEWMLAQVGIGPDRTFGPNYVIRDGRAHHVNETDGDPGAPAELGDDGMWRLGRGR